MTAAKLHTIDFSHGALLTPGKRFLRCNTPEKSSTSALWITHGKKKKKVAQNVENKKPRFRPPLVVHHCQHLLHKLSKIFSKKFSTSKTIDLKRKFFNINRVSHIY